MQAYYYFKARLFDWFEERAVRRSFYGCVPFRSCDLALLSAYQDHSPYTISKNYLQASGAKEVHCYGETPLTTMAQIVDAFEVTASDTIVELGAGRGRASLFLAEYVGCHVVAYERIPHFVEKVPKSPRLTMTLQDMLKANFSKATVVYLYGTMLEDREILALIEKFPPKRKIVTVSYPLSLYSDKYCVKKSLMGRFPWGKTEIYWNERTC
jgi:hypothetical protein